MTASSATSHDKPTWLAQNVRLTAFPTTSLEIANLKWWSQVAGAEPETRTEQPKKGVLQEEGPLGTGRLSLAVQPGLLTWQLVYQKEQTSDSHLYPIGAASDLFRTLMSKWLRLPNVPPINRIAFGAVLSIPVDSRPTGYRILQEYLRESVKIDSDASSDFSYQINRRRSSTTGVTGLAINRLARWAVTVTYGGTITITPGSIGGVLGEETHACALTLDINTAQEFKQELPRERLDAIFHELIAIGIEIATRGDVP